VTALLTSMIRRKWSIVICASGRAVRMGGGVTGVWIDNDELDRRVELPAASGQSRPHCGAGAAINLPQLGLVADQVHETRLPQNGPPPPNPALVTDTVRQPPGPTAPSWGWPSGRSATEHGPPGPRAVSWCGSDGPVRYGASWVRRRRRQP
jgi:hypothetical protein